MQPDGRFIQDVQHANEPAADLCGETNPLGFAAGQADRGTVEREIIESDIDEKT
jgi:hypothetical protein